MFRTDAVRRGLCAAAMGVFLVAGCTRSAKVHYLGDAELRHYKKQATRIDYPSVCTTPNDAAVLTDEPRRLGVPRKDELWDMPLHEAIHLALENNPVIRNRAQFLKSGISPLSDSATVFDPAIVESETIFGQQGVEAALSEFDAQFTTTATWGHDERVQNNAFLSGGLAPGSTLVEDTHAFRSRLEKQMATGGRVAVNHNWNYEWNNSPGRLFPSTYIGQLEAEYRQPLWAGAGTEFTRIAGPALRRDAFRASQSLDQGVVIARIRNDMSLADFQANVRNLLKDVEDSYWELYLGYQVYNGEVISRNASLDTWREVKARENVGIEGTAEEAQSRDSYFESRARAESALADIYEREGILRRLLGLPVNDGRVIRPCDEPITADYSPDWHMSLAEALTRRAELRRQKWQIKSLELQVEAAKSLTKPRMDFVSKYRVNGFGDHLLGETDYDGSSRQGLSSAYETMTENDQTGWNLGFEFTMPIGFRAARAQQRNTELRLAKARTVLATMEHEISHEVSNAFQGVSRWSQVMRTNYERFVAADERARAYETLYEKLGRESRVNVDLVLRSQISRAQASNEYFRSVVEYNKSIAGLHLRKETLLEHNGVHLAEAGWEKGAYEEALRRAWARSYAFDASKCLHSEPGEFASPFPREVSPAGHAQEGHVPHGGIATETAPPPSATGTGSPGNGRKDIEPPPPPMPPRGSDYNKDAAASAEGPTAAAEFPTEEVTPVEFTPSEEQPPPEEFAQPIEPPPLELDEPSEQDESAP